MAENTNKQQEESELEQYAQSIRDAKVERLRALSKTLFQDVANSVTKFTIPEDVFRYYFAEHFKSKLDDDKQSAYKYEGTDEKFTQWMCIAGGPFKEVDIIDSKGRVVDTVPSYFAKPTADKLIPDEAEIERIKKEYDLKKNGLVVRAENYLQSELNGIPIQANTYRDQLEHRARWDYILNKYTSHLDEANMKEEEKKKQLDSLPKVVKEELDLEF